MWHFLTKEHSLNAWYIQAMLAFVFMYPWLWLLIFAARLGLENSTQEKKENEK